MPVRLDSGRNLTTSVAPRCGFAAHPLRRRKRREPAALPRAAVCLKVPLGPWHCPEYLGRSWPAHGAGLLIAYSCPPGRPGQREGIRSRDAHQSFRTSEARFGNLILDQIFFGQCQEAPRLAQEGRDERYPAPYLPQHFLYFFPLPQGHGSLRPGSGIAR